MSEIKDLEFNDFDINQFDIDNFFIINDSEINSNSNNEENDTNVQFGTIGSSIENISNRAGLGEGRREGIREDGEEDYREDDREDDREDREFGEDREGRREGGREGRRECGREGEREGGREGGREGEREGGREGRKSRTHVLVEGRGIACNCFRTNPNKFCFRIFIYRERGEVHGRIEIKDDCGRCVAKSNDLESYTTSCRRNAVAVFDYEDPRTGACKPLTVYAKEGYCGNCAKIFVYSAPLDRNETRIGGCIDHGFIKIK